MGNDNNSYGKRRGDARGQIKVYHMERCWSFAIDILVLGHLGPHGQWEDERRVFP